HVFEQVGHAATVPPLVVVPAHELEEAFVQLDARAGVVNGRGGAVDEVAAHHFVGGVFEDAFEVGFCGLFHRSGDGRVAGFLHGAHGEIHHADGGRGNAKGHAGELALDLRADQADRPRSTGRGRNEVNGRATPAFPVFFAGAVHGLLGGGVAVDGGHQAFFDAKTLLEQDVNKRGQTIGGTTGVGDDVVACGIVLVVVHAHDDGDVLRLGGGGDDDLLSARQQVAMAGVSRDFNLLACARILLLELRFAREEP